MRRNTYGTTTAMVLGVVVLLTTTVLLLAGLLLTAGTVRGDTGSHAAGQVHTG